MFYTYDKKGRSSNNLNRYMIGDEENIFIQKLRDNEIKEPATFSHKLIWFDSHYKDSTPEEENIKDLPKGCFIDIETGEKLPPNIMNIPISNIIGLDNAGQLGNIKEEGLTFKEALFERLHGNALKQETIEYFIGNNLKKGSNDEWTPMPEAKDKRVDGQFARGGITFYRRGNSFIVDNGKHRVIMAMFAIYQTKGVKGMLKKVYVTNAPKTESDDKPSMFLNN